MSSFSEPLTVTKLANGKWKVERTFHYCVGYLGSSDIVEVPKGFESDFASVPRGLWNLLPPDGPYTQSAVLHDFLYSKRGNSPEGRNRTRKECDLIFLEAMVVLNVSAWKRYIMFWSVRIFGGLAW